MIANPRPSTFAERLNVRFTHTDRTRWHAGRVENPSRRGGGLRTTPLRGIEGLSAMEVPVKSARVVELLSQNASVLKEDVTCLEAGTFKFQAFGVDVTKEQAARLRANLSRLEQVISAISRSPC
jgi:hypothetical protein